MLKARWRSEFDQLAALKGRFNEICSSCDPKAVRRAWRRVRKEAFSPAKMGRPRHGVVRPDRAPVSVSQVERQIALLERCMIRRKQTLDGKFSAWFVRHPKYQPPSEENPLANFHWRPGREYEAAVIRPKLSAFLDSKFRDRQI